MRIFKVNNKKAKLQFNLNDCGFALKSVFLLGFCGLLLGSACTKRSDDNLQLLSPIETYRLSVKEPSDLCFDPVSGILYTVSDNTCKVYKLSTKGKVFAELNYTGNDLEGVTLDEDQHVYVAEERLRNIVKLDMQGNEIERKKITVETNVENEGLEGISYNSLNRHFYIINERNPAVLIETDEYFNILNNYQLSFADDYSGICVDNKNQQLWIVSDMSATVNKCNLQGQLIESYRIPVANAEGIALDVDNNKLYVVSDSEAVLYIFNY